MTPDQELTLEAAIAEADENARRINLDLLNQVLAEITREEDSTE